MNIRRADSGVSRQALESALRWFERLRDDDVPEKVVLEWLSWYEQSEENSRAFDELQDLWRLSQELSADSHGNSFIEQMQRYSWWDQCKWRAQSWLSGRVDSASDSLRRQWHPAIGWGAGILTAAVAAFLLPGWHIWTRAPIRDAQVATSRQELVHAMTLPDNSKIELAPRTTIAVAYSDSERRLDMSAGEANFVVAPNRKRPFVVHVDTLRVRAVGTQFNIHRADDRIVVTVIEGKIDIYRDSDRGDNQASAGAVVHVMAGHQYTVFGRSDPGTLSAAESQDALMWREGRLRFVNVPLAEVIADVNRYVSRPIVIEGEQLKSLTYTGTVFAASIDEWLGAIPKGFPLVVVTESDRTLLIPHTPEYGDNRRLGDSGG